MKKESPKDSLLFFVIAVLGIFGMIMCSKKLDSVKASANWVEEICNTVAQASFLLSMICAFERLF